MENRYARQIKVPGIGERGQQALNQASVLVIGCGGLGCPTSLALSRAGVGRIGLVDGDKVSITNLHRQTLFVESDVGDLKVEAAKRALESGNSTIQIEIFNERLTSDNYQFVFGNYDIIVDATDNFESRYLINDACLLLKRPLVYGAANQTEGQIAVFNLNGSGHLRDLFPEVPSDGTIQNCEDAGVLGPITSTIGNLMALEVLKIISKIGSPLINQLVHYNGLDASFHRVKYKQKEKYTPEIKSGVEPKAVSWNEYKKAFSEYELVDVRTILERNISHNGGMHIPLDELKTRINEIGGKKVVFYCKTGQRARKACMLYQELGGTTVYIV